jgi:hypothetical protein
MGQRPAPYEHYRPKNGTADPGVSRVVGLDDGAVALLRVADGDGERVHGGTVETVPRTRLDERVDAAENPDQRARLPRVLAGVGVGFLVVAALSWLSVFTTPATAGTLATVGVVLVAAGHVLDRFDLTVLRR